MCLIVFAWIAIPATNWCWQPTAMSFTSVPLRQACIWPERPDVLAGKDLLKMRNLVGNNQDRKICSLNQL